MRGLLITEVDRDMVPGTTKVMLHNPTPIDGLREWPAVVTKVNTNGTLNVRVDHRGGAQDVTSVKGEIPDDRMAWWSWIDEPAPEEAAPKGRGKARAEA